jgi:diphthine synthase
VERPESLGELIFVGLGLHDDNGISLRGLHQVQTADSVFMELYTNLMPDFSKERFEKTSGRRTVTVSRRELEEENGRKILDAAQTGKAVLLVPGDPLIATTHLALRIEAKKRGIHTSIIHGASIISAAIGLSGLHNYKFGKSVTIPFHDENPSDTPYAVIAQNKQLGLHTLCLLDVKVDQKRCLTIHDALNSLLCMEARKRQRVVTSDSLVVGVSMAGSDNPTIKAGFVGDILKADFGEPPHTLIIPGQLHFTEVEALRVLAGAPESLGETAH